jgi:nucleoside-diphosphate-sugar epimerase
MRVAIAGAHGKIAMLLSPRLTGGGHEVIGLIRNPDHADEVRATGAQPVVCDLEHGSVEEVAGAVAGADVVVFAAGAGPGSGAERKLTMDRDGAIKLLKAATAAGVRRYLIVSAVGAENPPADRGGEAEDVFGVYLRAKAEADNAVKASDLDWTIVRPGRLTDEPGTALVKISAEPFRGEVPRDDVAAVLDALLEDSRAAQRTLYLNSGDQPIPNALTGVLEAT